MYRKLEVFNQKGLAPFLMLFIAMLVILTGGLGIALYNSSKNGTLTLFEAGDRSFDTSTLSGSIGSFFKSLTSAEKANENAKPPDHTRLTLGDNRMSGNPQKGYIFSCIKNFNKNAGAGSMGPWIDQQAKTWDVTRKATVDGSIAWHSARWTISADKTTRRLSGNGLPKNHPTGLFPITNTDDAYQFDQNPNALKEQAIDLSLPLYPTTGSIPECVGGEVGIMLSGIPLFNGFDAGGRDAVAWEAQDVCAGHPQHDGVYHYHGPSSCLGDTSAEKEHSSLVGYAFDGFGIYGNKGANGKELSTAALDECHGHSHQIEWEGQNVDMYHYHLTQDFPYSVSCYRGKNAVSGPTRGKFGAEPVNQQQQNTTTNTPQIVNNTYIAPSNSGNSNDEIYPAYSIFNNQQWYQTYYQSSITPCNANSANNTCSGIAPAIDPNNPNPLPSPTPVAAPQPVYIAAAPTATPKSTSKTADKFTASGESSGTMSTSTAGSEESVVGGRTEIAAGATAVPTPSVAPAPSCTIQPSSTSNIVNSGSSITWTFNYPVTSMIKNINLQAQSGLKYSVNGQTSESGQGLNLALNPEQSTVQFTVLLDTACTPFTVPLILTNSCGGTFSTFVGYGSRSAFGAACR